MNWLNISQHHPVVKKAILYLPNDKEKCSGIVSLNIEGYNADDIIHLCSIPGVIVNEGLNILVLNKKYIDL